MVSRDARGRAHWAVTTPLERFGEPTSPTPGKLSRSNRERTVNWGAARRSRSLHVLHPWDPTSPMRRHQSSRNSAHWWTRVYGFGLAGLVAGTRRAEPIADCGPG